MSFPFNPKYGSTTSGSATATASVLAVAASSKQILLTNSGTQVVFVRITQSGSTTDATAADIPVLPGTQLMLTKPSLSGAAGDDYSRLSYIAPGGAGSTLYASSGVAWAG